METHIKKIENCQINNSQVINKKLISLIQKELNSHPSKKLLDIAQKFSNFPKETSFNNKKSRDYFSSKINSPCYSNSSTLKDNLTENLSYMPSSKGHKKSLSKTLYIINKNSIVNKLEILVEFPSVKKELYKIPSKHLDDSVELDGEDLYEEEEYNNNLKGENLPLTSEFKLQDSIVTKENHMLEVIIDNKQKDLVRLNSNLINFIKFEEIFKICQIFENLIKNFENFPLFLMKYKENFELIENWFDLSSKFDIYESNKDHLEILTTDTGSDSSSFFLKTKIHRILEVVIFGFIIKLYELVRNNYNIIQGNECFFDLYNDFKSCLQLSYNNFLIASNQIINKSNSGQGIQNNEINSSNKIKFPIQEDKNSYEHKCKETLKQNKFWLKCLDIEKGININNSSIQKIISKSIEKLEKIFNQISRNILKQQNPNINLNNSNSISQIHIQEISCSLELENSIYTNTDMKNLEYVFYSLANYEKVNYSEFREYIYNEYLVANLLKINLINCESTPFEVEENNYIESDMSVEVETENKLANRERSETKVQNFDEENPKINEESSNILATQGIVLNIPFLPPIDTKKYKYTLVLDLDETLVHYIEDETEAYVQVRPYAEHFLKELCEFYEIVIFTAATEEYADIVLNELDKEKSISHKLYRRHTNYQGETFIKDLTKLGRDIKKTFIIDNIRENFMLHPNNGLHISSFTGDEDDSELLDLIEDLKGKKINLY
jgi:Dullard-like phosphatase family protein